MLIQKTAIKKQAGIGLIESLIALLVISIGLLGIAALQITSLRQSSSAQNHSQAVWFSYEMTDRIAANRGAFNQYIGIDTDNGYSTDCTGTGASCLPAEMALADATDWSDLVKTLPSGRGVITQPNPGENTLQITVMWDDGSDESNCINNEPGSAGMTCYTVTIQ